MSKSLETYKAVATLEMSAMSDDKMTVEKAEELRQVIEKELNVLEIIKERKVDIYLLEITKNVDQYNRPFGDHLVSLCRLLNEEEYDLLKEFLL